MNEKDDQSPDQARTAEVVRSGGVPPKPQVGTIPQLNISDSDLTRGELGSQQVVTPGPKQPPPTPPIVPDPDQMPTQHPSTNPTPHKG